MSVFLVLILSMINGRNDLILAYQTGVSVTPFLGNTPMGGYPASLVTAQWVSLGRIFPSEWQHDRYYYS
jgi:hypothetical protein